VIRNLKIRFPPFSSLNDPFEGLPLIDVSDVANEFFNEVMGDLDQMLNAAENDNERSQIEFTRNELKEKIKQTFNPHSIGNEIRKNLGEKFGILSLSRTSNNKLMWSHYANSGAGYVIEFDDRHQFFHAKAANGESTRPLPVIYTNNRQAIQSDEKQIYQKMLCVKPLDWAYEEEERLFKYHTYIDKNAAKDEYGNSIILSPIPKEAIKGIYLGYAADQKFKDEVIEIVRENNIDCPIYPGKISEKYYQIEFSAITK
jgi:hypothetical protein